MSAKRILVISILALFCFSPMQGPLSSHLQADDGVLEAGPASLEILMMGNSYTSANSLDSIVDGVLSAASNSANVTSLTGGGMRLSQHSSNVASSGHQWNTTLNNGVWNWVVLQDQSQIPGFPRNNQEWINSKNGAVQLAQTIDDKGADSVLMMTWGRRDGDSVNTQRFPDFSTMQDELEAGYLDYRDNMSSHGDVWVAPVGLAFEHIHDQIIANGGTPTNSGNLFYDLYSSDGSHPSISGSYLAALVIYATITGDDPVGLSHSTSLSNSVVLELQQAASATVFNETSHLDYPWQNTNSGGGNNGPSINIPANQTLAWEKVQAISSGNIDDALDLKVDSNGNIIILGLFRASFNLGTCSATLGNSNALSNLFIAKLNSNYDCLWISTINTPGATSGNELAIDSNDNIYLVFSTNNCQHCSTTSRVSFSPDPFALSFDMPSSVEGVVSLVKLSSDGNWTWRSNIDWSGYSFHHITLDSANNIWTSKYSEYQTHFHKHNSTTGTIIASKVLGTAKSPGNSPCAQCMIINGIETDSNDNLYASGEFYAGSSFMISINGTSHNIAYGAGWKPILLKMDIDGNILSYNTPIASSSGEFLDIKIDTNDNVYVSGTFYADLDFGNITLSTGGNMNGFVAKYDSNNTFIWAKHILSQSSITPAKLELDQSDNLYVTGNFNSGGNNLYFDGFIVTPSGSSSDAFVAKYDSAGVIQWAKSFGSSGVEMGKGLYFYSNSLHVIGTFDSSAFQLGALSTISSSGLADLFVAKMSADYDGDEMPDVNDVDDDGDFIHDTLDSCHYSQLGFRSTGISDHDSDGCDDEYEDDDDDNDMLNDSLDDCPKGMTGWIRTNSSDIDNDGCMDALEDYDDDNDGFEDYDDYCSRIPGNSTMEFEKGCPDSDGDGRPDILDPFADDPTEWSDRDGDGVGDNSDAFPLDATQQSDIDGDTYGDEEFGNAGDSCPEIFGNSTIDRYGCLDSDGDGWSDAGDDFPNDPAIHLDTDGDTIPDHLDDFPFDPTQKTDSDGDGYGDNANGNLADAFPNDPFKHSDADRDGRDDGSDAFPYDPTQWKDTDGDGMGDNPMGIGADKFPNDVSQWGDIDGDGYGDNSSGTDADAFTTDATQWSDIDGDGYGDNPAGRLYDLFPNDATQWEDADGDGLGDNLTGDNADPYLNDFDNDGYPDNVDILPKFYSPGDLDNDGCFDDVDAFPADMRECFDNDEDGEGNNADTDDDNDGWADTDERRLGTDPFDANDVPVDSFEIVIPGTSIGLGAWDLIGMFGGLPLFAWIGFGFVTRNRRCERYLQQLKAATTRKELEDIAIRSEYSLMLRMLGPHQGIKLERLRAELDDVLENEANLIVQGFDQTELIVAHEKLSSDKDTKILPEISTKNVPATSLTAEKVDANGFEWVQFEGENWYRVTDSNSDWSLFE